MGLPYGVTRSDIAERWKWANIHNTAILGVVYENAAHLIEIEEASLERDTQYATDYMLTLTGCDIACRVRESDALRFHDMTIRAKVASGHKTELQKIKEGHADWYIYAWSDGRDGFADWWLVSLDKLRDSGLLETNRRLIPNIDRRSWFIGIAAPELRRHGCIVAEKNHANQGHSD